MLKDWANIMRSHGAPAEERPWHLKRVALLDDSVAAEQAGEKRPDLAVELLGWAMMQEGERKYPAFAADLRATAAAIT